MNPSFKTVEVIGRPGAGKSTFARRVAAELNIPVLTNPGKSISSIGLSGRLSMLFQAPLFGCLVHCCVLSRSRVAYYDQLRRVSRVQAQFLALRSGGQRGNKTVLIDEGPIHALFSCLFGSRSTPVSDFFLRKLIRSILDKVDVALFLNVDQLECQRNFSSRISSNSRFNRTSDSELVDIYVEDKTYEEIIALIQSERESALEIADSLESATKQLALLKTS